MIIYDGRANLWFNCSVPEFCLENTSSYFNVRIFLQDRYIIFQIRYICAWQVFKGLKCSFSLDSWPLEICGLISSLFYCSSLRHPIWAQAIIMYCQLSRVTKLIHILILVFTYSHIPFLGLVLFRQICCVHSLLGLFGYYCEGFPQLIKPTEE